jgi:hypothetical protein
MRARLSALIDELRRLNTAERYRPSPTADCWFCEYKSLCSLYPEGAPLFPVEDELVATAGEDRR